MRLTIWSKTIPAKVLRNLSPVLRTAADVKATVVADQSIPEGTTAILALGSESLKKLQADKILAKNRTTTSYRTIPHMVGGIPVLVSYSPEIGEIDHGYYIDLLTDVSLALRFCLTGKWHPIYGNYRYVHDFSELCHNIEQQHAETGQPVDVAKDLETLGLDPYAESMLMPYFPGAYIVSMQASYKKGTADVVRFVDRMHESQRLSDPAFREQIEFLLRCPYVRLKGANFKYDLHWLWKRGGFTCSTFTFDTTIVGSLLDENRSNALDVHVKIYTNTLGGYSDQFDRTVDKSRMDKVPPDALLPYAGGDVDGGLQVAEAMKQELLQDKQLTSFYVNVLHPAARAFEQVEQGGIVIDPEAFKELKSDLEHEHARLVKEASHIMGGRIVIKHGYHSLLGLGAMNLTKASMLCDFMFGPMGLNLKPKLWTPKPDKDGIKRPSTAMEHLEMFAEDPKAKEFVDIIRQDSSVMKTYNTYVVGFLEHLRSDGRFHPNYFLYVGNHEEGEGGAKTGRLSCKAPAFQCCVGETEVLTNSGYRSIESIVNGVGSGYVKTHTGEWKAIVGTYRNGVRPVFRITTNTGKQVTCTANHPIRTPLGWVRTSNLSVGDSILTHRLKERDRASIQGFNGQDVWSVDGLKETRNRQPSHLALPMRLRKDTEREGRESGVGQYPDVRVFVGEGQVQARPSVESREDDSNVSVVDRHEDEVSEPAKHSVEVLRGAWDSSLREVAGLRQLLEGHGRNALRILAGEEGSEWELRAEQLHLDSQIRAESQQEEFQEEQIICIECLGDRETFDLTIEDSHSFIANGIVVHNTVPKHTAWAQRIRRCYPAPPGFVVVERDYGQGELRVVACIANETNMLNVFKSGKDIHADTAAPFAGFTYDSLMALEKTDVYKFEETRQLGKAGNFGLVFGMKEDGFVAYAKGNYGVALTWDEAHEFRETFFKKYPRLVDYHNHAIQFAKQFKHVRTPLGRIRHLPLIKSPNREVAAKAERQAINSPVQGTLTDMTLWTIALENKWGLSKIAPCFGACHDSLLNYVPEDKVDQIVPQMLDQMENLPFHEVGWHPKVKFIADAKVGKNWGSMKKFQR